MANAWGSECKNAQQCVQLDFYMRNGLILGLGLRVTVYKNVHDVCSIIFLILTTAPLGIQSVASVEADMDANFGRAMHRCISEAL